MCHNFYIGILFKGREAMWNRMIHPAPSGIDTSPKLNCDCDIGGDEYGTIYHLIGAHLSPLISQGKGLF